MTANERRKKFRKLIEEGRPYAEIAKLMGCSRDIVYKFVNRHGLQRRERTRNERLRRLRKLVAEGKSMSECAEALQCDNSTVYRDAKELGLPFAVKERPSGDCVLVAVRDNPGATAAEIVERLGCSRYDVLRARKRLRNQGIIPFRDDRENDQILYRQRVVRPAWYVAEVCGKGFIGMQLHPEAWERYLTLYERYKNQAQTYDSGEE